ncbi:(R)-citramalate synthase CimA [uncultured archaeon]|nr:(R)-citramalate synthase CimA [uncultured archaeon]
MTVSSSIKIHDTTLRDGEQMSGVVFDFDEKLRIAEKAIDFGVDLIDIMPVVSDGEFKVTKELAGRFGSKVSAACRCKKSDVDLSIDAGACRVTLISPLSDLHITQRLRITREENLNNAAELVDYARAHGLIVDIAGEDASRADLDYLKLFLECVHDKIALFVLSDTVGCLTPKSTRDLVSYVKENSDCDVCLHLHNDFGLATANTIEGIMAGADYFSGTFTGIGERAGNAPIEEVCTALHFLYGKELEVKYGMLKEICDMVQELSGVKTQRHKPIIGENAFSHESGIHIDGVLKNPKTYEFLDPEVVGQKRRICLGKHSGKKALQYVLGDKFSLENFDSVDVDLILKEIKTMRKDNAVSVSSEDVLEIISRLESQKQR